MNKQDQLDEYLSSVYILSHSHQTVRTYRNAITNQNKSGFRDFLDERHNMDEHKFVSRVTSNQMDLYKTLREYVVFLDQQNFAPKTIKSKMAAINGYLRHLGLKIYSEDLKQNMRMPKPVKHREIPLTKEIIQRLLRNSTPRLQTAILVCASSGMRIGELVQLKLSDIDMNTTPVTVNIRAETTKTRQARETFLTTEAVNSLKDYLIRHFGWSENSSNINDVCIFGRTALNRTLKEKTKDSSYTSSTSLLIRALKLQLDKIPDLQAKNPNGRNAIHFHAFRKYFRTTVGNEVGRDFAEALIGHSFYMDTYYQLPEDKKREMYLKAEQFLTFSENSKLEGDLRSVSEKYHALEEKVNRLMRYMETQSIQVPELLH